MELTKEDVEFRAALAEDEKEEAVA